MRNYSLLTLLALFLFGACREKEKTPLQIPAQYDGTAFAANAATETALIGQIETLVTEIKKGRTNGVRLDYAALSALYNAGNPTLKQITTPYYAGRVDGVGQWLSEMALAAGNSYAPGPPSGQGGTYNGYLFDENGLEPEQMVEKGLFGAALYYHAVLLMQNPAGPEIGDRLLRIFGANPDFPNTPTAGKTANPDKLMAGYAARRDNNDGTGLYFQIKNGFIALQAALKAGSAYDEERDAAFKTIRTNWEKVNAGTVINYCYSVVSAMSATAPTEVDKAKALHAYSECVGFLHGWRTIPQAYKIASDAEIDAWLTLLNAPYNGVPTSYKFVTDPLTELPKLLQLVAQIKTRYGFTDQEMEEFKKNWVTEQGR